MLSKCANPECSETFRYLREGQIFRLAPNPDLRITMRVSNPALQERFWLCARCAKEMTLIWDGAQVKLVRQPGESGPLLPPSVRQSEARRRHARARAASAGREDE